MVLAQSYECRNLAMSQGLPPTHRAAMPVKGASTPQLPAPKFKTHRL